MSEARSYEPIVGGYPAELLDQRFRLGQVIGPVTGNRGLVADTARAGEGLGLRVQVGEDVLADGREIGRVVDGLPGQDVVERRDGRVELEIIWGGGKLVGDREMLPGLLQQRRRGHVLVDLAFTGEHRLVGGLVTADRLEGELVQVGAARLPVSGVALEYQYRAEGVAHDLNGPAPTGLSANCFSPIFFRAVGDAIQFGVESKNELMIAAYTWVR